MRESQAISDPNIYNAGQQNNDVFSEENTFDYSVRDPQDFHGHIVYVVKGKDLQGAWECKRRYNEFYLLQEALCKRWPGIVLPQIPPKRAMGNKESVFLQERRYYLERFLRKMARYDFIINSQEFQIFARPQGLEVEKSLNKLPKLSSSQLYDRLKEATMTDDTLMSEVDRDLIQTQLEEFATYIKKAEPFLKKLKVDLATYLSKKQAVMESYAGAANQLTEYEDNNLRFYTNQAVEKLVINNPEAGNLIDNMRHTIENLRNPFTDLYHWVKGELYDLAAFTAALKERKDVATAVTSLKGKIEGAKSDIDAVNAGKKTMGTLFKNSNDVGKMQNSLEGYERDLEAQTKLLDVLSLYLGRQVLP